MRRAQDRLEDRLSGRGGLEQHRRDLRGLPAHPDRKDIDAVLIAMPDHWHSPMTVDACAAGRDRTVEKPVSNEIAPALEDGGSRARVLRVVQAGLQQRSWHHFR